MNVWYNIVFKAKHAYSVLNSGAIDTEVKSNYVLKKETII